MSRSTGELHVNNERQISVLKRAFDIVASIAGIILLLPVLLPIALAVGWYDGWPVIFLQRRVGKNGRHFNIFKFRTMTNNPQNTVQVTAANDPRITRVGRFLRCFKLDELPQLLNVLNGDMSLVGPRPEVPKYVILWNDRQKRLILSVRPGITDQSQLVFFNEEKILAQSANPERTYIEKIMPKKLQICEGYVQNAGFLTDLKILIATVWVLLFGRSDKATTLLTVKGKVNEG